MPTNITDVDAFTAPVTSPADGDVRNAASVFTSLQQLANRARNLVNRVTDIEIDYVWFTTFSTDQDQFGGGDWPRARFVKADGIGAPRQFYGMSTSGVVAKRKTIVNVGSSTIEFVHQSPSAALSGYRIICPYSVSFFLYPGTAVELTYDATAQRWRILEGFRLAEYDYPVAKTPTRFVSAAKWRAAVGSQVGGANWIGGVLSLGIDSMQAIADLNDVLQDGCTINQIDFRIQPGLAQTGTSRMSFSLWVKDTFTGSFATAVAQKYCDSTNTEQTLSLDGFSATIDKDTKTYTLMVQAGAGASSTSDAVYATRIPSISVPGLRP